MATFTFPNQRVIKINREKAVSDFLGIKNENWQAAARNLSPHSLLLYLYLAANANNYQLALSAAAVRDAVGMARSTYHDQFHILLNKGYLVPNHGNTYDFYEVPRPRSEAQSASQERRLLGDGLINENGTSAGIDGELPVHDVSSHNTEINNINVNKQSAINNNAPIPEENRNLIPPIREVIIKRPTAKGKYDFENYHLPKKYGFIF